MADEVKVRSKIQQQIDEAWDRFRGEIHKKRLMYARSGHVKYRQHKLVEAIQDYQIYIKILEETKKVPEGGLKPEHFDKVQDAAELLIINAVYWDLLKVYDRTSSEDKRRQLSEYLEKFYLFTKGMPHEGVSIETLRQYVSFERPVHKKEFLAMYRRLDQSKCFIATSLVDEMDENATQKLRRFRDERLRGKKIGEFLISLYETISPGIASLLIQAPRLVRKKTASLLSVLANHLQGQ